MPSGPPLDEGEDNDVYIRELSRSEVEAMRDAMQRAEVPKPNGLNEGDFEQEPHYSPRYIAVINRYWLDKPLGKFKGEVGNIKTEFVSMKTDEKQTWLDV